MRTILGGDRIQGTRDAQGVGELPKLEGTPTERPTPENVSIMSRPLSVKETDQRSEWEKFIGIS